MLTAKTFTENQLSNLTTVPRPSLSMAGRVSNPEGVPSTLVIEAEKLEAELETFISRAYPSYSRSDVRPRMQKRLKDNAQRLVRDFLVTAAVEVIGSFSEFDNPWAVCNSAFEENKTLKTILRKCKHLMATIKSDKPWQVREEAIDLTRYVKKMEPAFTNYRSRNNRKEPHLY